MKKTILIFTLLLAFQITFSSVSHATKMYDSFGPSDTYSSSQWALGQTQKMAIAFTPDDNYIFESIEFVGSFLFGNPDPTLPNQPAIHLAKGTNEPSTILESFELLTLTNAPTLFTVTSTLNNLLIAGEQYWVIFDSGNLPALFAINLNNQGYGDPWTDNGDGVWWGPAMSTAPVARVNGTIAPVPEPSTLSVTVSGQGTIYSTPGPDMACSNKCTQDYVNGTIVTLTAVPSTNYSFAGWSGDCDGTGSCTVTMDAAKSVTATFPVYIPYPVILEGSRATFTTIQQAYDSILGQIDTIKVKAGDQSPGDLMFDRDVTIKLEGGYDDIFSDIVSDTSFYGTFTVYAGQITVSDIVIK